MQASLLQGGQAIEETVEFQQAVLRERQRLEKVGGKVLKLTTYTVDYLGWSRNIQANLQLYTQSASDLKKRRPSWPRKGLNGKASYR
jgi:hypothetical protein